DFDCYMRDEGERAHSEGALFLTNIQQFYERPGRTTEDEPDEITAVMGPKPQTQKLELTDFDERIARRRGPLLVLNDEAHHTHDEDSEWNKVIRKLHTQNPLASQLDFSATPRYQKGGLFAWTLYDYPLKQAILDGVVKRPVKGVADIQEAKSDIASVRYEGFLTAGVERWKEYCEQLAPLGKKPILFVMLNSTAEADEVGDYLRVKYPNELGGDKTLVIHTDTKGEVSRKDLDTARQLAREVDEPDCPVNAIVSVLMLREGWDVQNVTVVVGLRPYTSKANILPEQTIGRGLRLMFRGQVSDYTERVDVIGNKAFIVFVEDLEKLEGITLDTFDVGKDKLRILTIMPMPEKMAYDIGVPTLSPLLVRKKSLAADIANLDVMALNCPVLPRKKGDAVEKTFHYEGYDIITLEKMIERDYTIPEPQTAQEVIGYYARRIASDVKLPSQFAALAPKVREFFERKAFGAVVNLDDKALIKAMSSNVASYVVVKTFGKALREKVIEPTEPQLTAPERMLSSAPPFPHSRPTFEAAKCVFNYVPCDNEFERDFAKFLQIAGDVEAFSKLPEPFGFAIEYTDAAANLRYYYPDFVVRLTNGENWIVETKGQETLEAERKAAAAQIWCENATMLTGTAWQYLKVPQKDFERLQPSLFSDVVML
ncbi:DEAD/DEAH box helicase family protein, partial [Candidatus Poribacteria bacterium]|nr:DEAD/DEAH box helicase family protein [Candidatus Poribacteria bacterium]